MENKKTLWIIAAVGAFLLVVLGAAVIVYSPSERNAQTIARNTPSERVYDGFINQDQPAPSSIEHPLNFPNQNVTTGSEPIRTNEVYVVADKANVFEVPSNNGTTIDLNSLKTLKDNSAEAPAQNINVTVTFADKPNAPAPRDRAPRSLDNPAKKDFAEAKASKPAQVAVKKADSKPKAAAKPAPSAPSKFWVQVAAYSNKKGAETARQALGTNQIQADIFTYKDNKENLFYRVRVGPYTTKSEAEYWRQKITKISEFSNAKSYVTSTN